MLWRWPNNIPTLMSDSARTISTEVLVRGQKFNANEITIQSFVNGSTSFALSGTFDSDAKAQETSVELPVSKFVQEAADHQKHILETPRLSPDVSIKVDTLGEKGTADQNAVYAGYLSSPNFGVTGSMVSRSFSAAGMDQQLAMFVGSIYGVTLKDGPDILKNVDFSAPSFAGLLLNVLDWLMAQFEKYKRTDSTSDFDKAIALPTHERNKRLMPFIRKSLEASEPLTLYPELKATVRTSAGKNILDNAMITALCDCIVAQPNLFVGITGAFVGAFPCVYVPALDESGFRLKLVDVVNETQEDRVVPPSSLAFNAGSSYALPLKGVVITTTQRAREATETNADRRVLEKMAAIYPEGVTNQTVLEGATFQKIGAPLWIPNVQPGVTATGARAFREFVDGKLDAGTAEGRKKLAEALFSTKSKTAQELLNRYCRSQYYFLALAGARATVNLPLNFSFTPGVCYRLSDTSDTGANRPLFSGFVQSVSHRIKSDGGGEALTTVMMSHIRMEGFELPG